MSYEKLTELLVSLKLIGVEHSTVERAADLLLEIAAIHQPDREPTTESPSVWCGACGTGWPCPTARTLGVASR